MNPEISSDKNFTNSWSIGIKNINSGNEEYTFEQIKVLLCDFLCDKYPSIKPDLMLGLFLEK